MGVGPLPGPLWITGLISSNHLLSTFFFKLSHEQKILGNIFFNIAHQKLLYRKSKSTKVYCRKIHIFSISLSFVNQVSIKSWKLQSFFFDFHGFFCTLGQNSANLAYHSIWLKYFFILYLYNIKKYL